MRSKIIVSTSCHPAVPGHSPRTRGSSESSTIRGLFLEPRVLEHDNAQQFQPKFASSSAFDISIGVLKNKMQS